MEIRQAFPNEIGAIITVIESARTALAEAGSSQWQGADGYPTEETIFDDVLKGQAYVGIIDGQIVSYAAVVTDGDPAYDKSMMETGSIITSATLPSIGLPF